MKLAGDKCPNLSALFIGGEENSFITPSLHRQSRRRKMKDRKGFCSFSTDFHQGQDSFGPFRRIFFEQNLRILPAPNHCGPL
jgi:hypothetical protein